MPAAFSIQLNQNATPQLQHYLLNTSRLMLRYQQPTELLQPCISGVKPRAGRDNNLPGSWHLSSPLSPPSSSPSCVTGTA